ncbi:MAG: MFS transporter [Betaproteobacteria bacterium]|nr:MFS transporter [Betaproteobacteria bacterium]
MFSSHYSELFSHKAFMRFWLARLMGISANQMLMLGIAWHMYDITGSAWDLGLVGLFQFIPALLMALPAGQLIDRLHRGRIFASCMMLQGVVALVLLWATLNHVESRELIFAIALVLGINRSFQMPSQQAITPLLVPKELLQRATALSSTGVEIAIIGGPAVGGAIYTQGAASVYVCCAVLFVCAFALTLSVRYKHLPSHLAASWHSLFLDLFAVLLGGATALLPIFAKDILHGGPQELGYLRAAPAVGALLMSLIITRWPIEKAIGFKLLAAVAVFGLANIGFGLSTHLGLSIAFLAIAGAADNISVVTRLTLMQIETPDEMRGRVAAVNGVFIGASNELGEFESGATAALIGPVGSVVLGGAGTILVAWAWLKWFPDLAKRDTMASP